MYRFFIPLNQLNRSIPFITGSDANHLNQVLRLKPGEIIELFDGNGYNYQAKIIDQSSQRVSLEILDQYQSNTDSPLRLIVAQAILKNRKMDVLVRQLTELGAVQWIPFTAARSVVIPKIKRFENRIKRWKIISREALKQCKRGRLIDIGPFLSFQELLKQAENCDLSIIFYENSTASIISDLFQPKIKPKQLMIIMGPEGGFTSSEIKQAQDIGVSCATLGPRILRAETATIAACALVQYIFGDMA